MTTTETLEPMIRDFEKRVNEVERVLGKLTEMSATMEATVELLVERGLIDRGQLRRRADHALRLHHERLSPYAAEELQWMWESMLDKQLDSVDEEEMGHA